MNPRHRFVVFKVDWDINVVDGFCENRDLVDFQGWCDALHCWGVADRCAGYCYPNAEHCQPRETQQTLASVGWCGTTPR